MIPKFASWSYRRTDVADSATIGIAISLDWSDEDIQFKKLIPLSAKEFFTFLMFIQPNDEGFDKVVTVIKTDENTCDEEYIPAGSYYCYYTVPTKKFSLLTTNLIIFDAYDKDNRIVVDFPCVFSDLYISTLQLPVNTFIHN